MDDPPGDITILLQQWKQGVPGAQEKLFEMVFLHLRSLARNWLRKEKQGHPLDSVGLVGESFLRLLPRKDRVEWQNRDHFFAYTNRIMRNYLIDMGRKRDQERLVPLPSGDLPAHGHDLDKAIDVAMCLEGLEQEDPELCQVVALKFFLQLTDRETAEIMNLRLKTMQNRWHKARRWLFECMKDVE
jgi:RNA polymerase sigma-70 factor, ECF subfamily